MAKQRPVPPGGRKPANTGERQATPVRPPTAPTPPGPRRPAAGDPSDPRPIPAPFMHHPVPGMQQDLPAPGDEHQPVQGEAQWEADSAGPDEEPPTLDHRFPFAGQPGFTQQPAAGQPAAGHPTAGQLAAGHPTAGQLAAGRPGPARPVPATGDARATPLPRPVGRPMPSPRRTPSNASLAAGHPYPSDEGYFPAAGDPARRGPVRQGGLSGPPDSGFAAGPRTPGETTAPRNPSEGIGPRDPGEAITPSTPGETTAPRNPGEETGPRDPGEATASRDPVKTNSPHHPVETNNPHHPVGTNGSHRPVGTNSPHHPSETNSPHRPSETTGPHHPGETTGPRHPGETTGPHHPRDTNGPRIPGEATGHDVTANLRLPDPRNGPRTTNPDPAAATHPNAAHLNATHPNAAHPGPADGRGNWRAFSRRTDTMGVAKVPPRRPLLPGLELQPMVHVGDMPAAVAFYERLGGEINHGDRTGEWVLMQVGTAQIGLVTRPPDPSRGESTVELNFTATMPLDRLERLLRERGVTVVEVAVDRDLGTRLHVETPDGMPVKIHQVEPDLLV